MQHICVEPELVNESFAKIATLQKANSDLRHAIQDSFKSIICDKDTVTLYAESAKKLISMFNQNCYEPIVLDKTNGEIIISTIRNLRNEIDITNTKIERHARQGAFDITIEKLEMQVDALSDTINLLIEFCVLDPVGDDAREHIQEFGL
jgi:hypothetical protein